ncbi:hypothetical protein ACQEVG_30970 [Streptomyces sp. CA-135486]
MRGVRSFLDPGERLFGLPPGEWETSMGGTTDNALYRAFPAYRARR